MFNKAWKFACLFNLKLRPIPCIGISFWIALYLSPNVYMLVSRILVLAQNILSVVMISAYIYVS